jgi:hypothetical protein
MIGYVIIARKKHGDKVEVVETSVSCAGAETYAQELYSKHQWDMVMVAEVNKDACAPDGTRLRKVMKIERSCKHHNIQSDFIAGGMTCMECGMVFNQAQTQSSIIENTPEVSLALA